MSATISRYGQEVEWSWEAEFARARTRQQWVRSVAQLFADEFRRRRVAKDMSQEHVAVTMALIYGHRTWRQATVANVESGKRDVKLAEAAALAEIVGYALPDLLARLPFDPESSVGENSATQEVEPDGEHPEEA